MQPPLANPPRTLMPHALGAAGMYGVDAFVMAQGVLSTLATLVFSVIGLVHLLSGISGDRSRIRHGFAILVVWIGAQSMIYGTIHVNNRIARQRADKIVVALEAYKAAHGEYPPDLGALVPAHMPSVPVAKYTLMFNGFTYYYDPKEKGGFLSYVDIPPFGRPSYNLSRGKWGYID